MRLKTQLAIAALILGLVTIVWLQAPPTTSFVLKPAQSRECMLNGGPGCPFNPAIQAVQEAPVVPYECDNRSRSSDDQAVQRRYISDNTWAIGPDGRTLLQLVSGEAMVYYYPDSCTFSVTSQTTSIPEGSKYRSVHFVSYTGTGLPPSQLPVGKICLGTNPPTFTANGLQFHCDSLVNE